MWKCDSLLSSLPINVVFVEFEEKVKYFDGFLTWDAHMPWTSVYLSSVKTTYSAQCNGLFDYSVI